jgi:hypothetical protein
VDMGARLCRECFDEFEKRKQTHLFWNRNWLPFLPNKEIMNILGARMMYHLDPSQQEAAIKQATTLDKDIEGVNLQVCSLFGYSNE